MNSDLLTTTEAAALLCCTSRAFCAFARLHGIPFVPVRSRVVMWRRSDIERAIEDSRVLPGKHGRIRDARVRAKRSTRSGDAGDRIQQLLNQVRATSPS